MDRKNLDRLRSKYTDGHSEKELNPIFQRVSEQLFNAEGTRNAPYAGISTLLSAPYMPSAASSDNFENLQVALVGVPMDLGVSNRPGARFGPRAMRTIERIGPYNHELDCMPVSDLRVGDIGDVPFRSRFSLDSCHDDIESFFTRIVKAGVVPLAVGGDHSVTHPILRAFGSDQPVGMIHFDAHCDTGGEYDGSKFHHGGPFRNAVLDGVLDPARSIQIGIRGSSEYLWEFSEDAGMTVMHIEDINRLGCDAVIAKAREVVGDGPVYVTFDVDALDPAFAPGTGTPEVGGMSSREAIQILRGLKGLNIVGGDVVEVAPQYDATTNTAHIGSQLLFEILSLMVFSPALTGQRK
ncbi:agmatinase [Woeseia oceani]|uniref:Agmatinase n=1 Tax=Woeseia oceani TaxID=1548547 RepID=A0A193LDH8_9GAMM|nr:agmatinase [Woeseia oceani]ANO50585.1 agmatinase [Woeseia oceani]